MPDWRGKRTWGKQGNQENPSWSFHCTQSAQPAAILTPADPVAPGYSVWSKWLTRQLLAFKAILGLSVGSGSLLGCHVGAQS